MRKGEQTRAKIIEAAAVLFEKEGFSGAGLNAILDASGAPRGSLYFHFPGGKEELAIASIDASREALLHDVDAVLRGARSASAGLTRVLTLLGDRLEAAEFEKGCPIASIAASSSVAPPLVREAASKSLTELEGRLSSFLVHHGVSSREAPRRASVILAAIEGALVLGRIHRSREPIARVTKAIAGLVGEQ